MAWRWTAVVAVAGLAFAGCAMQATGRAPRHTGMGRAPSSLDVSSLGIHEVEGRVRSVDQSLGVVVVEQGDGTVQLQTAGDTAFFVEGGVARFGDLREGVAIRASFTEENGKRVAHWIEIPRPEDAEDGRGFEKAGQEVAR